MMMINRLFLSVLLSLLLMPLAVAEDAEGDSDTAEPSAGGIAAAFHRRDSVTLRDGSVIDGTILMAGERGIVLVVEDAEDTERFIPLKRVKMVKRAVRREDNATSQSLVKYFEIASEDGRLVLKEGDSAQLSAEQEEKRRAALPERTARGQALREELAAKRKAERERRRKESTLGGLLGRGKKKISEEEKLEREVLDLFGGADDSKRKDEPLLAPVDDEAEKNRND
ncbi:MAG: hypothetical protein ACYTGH_09590 [Planctomycetota bacterium]|jgi:hypothetical protein